MQGTAFRDASPPCGGWYWIRWEPGDDKEHLVWLWYSGPEEPQDEPRERDVERWLWGWSPTDDPESICLDIADPLAIAWRPGKDEANSHSISS